SCLYSHIRGWRRTFAGRRFLIIPSSKPLRTCTVTPAVPRDSGRRCAEPTPDDASGDRDERLPRSFTDNRDERAELAIAEVETQPGDDADQDRHEKHAVPGMQVGRDRTAEV